jgi:hypothetical protein
VAIARKTASTHGINQGNQEPILLVLVHTGTVPQAGATASNQRWQGSNYCYVSINVDLSHVFL